MVQGSDIYSYRMPKWQIIEHTSTVNRGEHVIHTGGKYDSHLLVPVIPADWRAVRLTGCRKNGEHLAQKVVHVVHVEAGPMPALLPHLSTITI